MITPATPSPRVVLVPGVPALLPAYAGLADPVAELRAACLAAVGWLVEGAPGVVAVLADPQGRRVAEHLLAAVGFAGEVTAHLSADVPPVMVVGNGSARRSEKAPGHLDERSFAFDAHLEQALRKPDPGALAGLDAELGAELLAGGIPALQALSGCLSGDEIVTVDYADDPFGVQYWVMRWACAS